MMRFVANLGKAFELAPKSRPNRSLNPKRVRVGIALTLLAIAAVAFRFHQVETSKDLDSVKARAIRALVAKDDQAICRELMTAHLHAVGATREDVRSLLKHVVFPKLKGFELTPKAVEEDPHAPWRSAWASVSKNGKEVTILPIDVYQTADGAQMSMERLTAIALAVPFLEKSQDALNGWDESKILIASPRLAVLCGLLASKKEIAATQVAGEAKSTRNGVVVLSWDEVIESEYRAVQWLLGASSQQVDALTKKVCGQSAGLNRTARSASEIEATKTASFPKI